MKLRAFTQIELLVVIGIIVFLAAIMIPALGLSRKYAQAMLCGSNIRQITLGLISYDLNNDCFPYSFYYSDDSDDMALPSGGGLGSISRDNAGWRWHDYICDNVTVEEKGESVFWCPSRKMENMIFKYNVLIANYGVNQSVCKSRDPFRENEFTGPSLSSTDIIFPGQSLLVVDSGYSTINWHHVTNSPPTPLGKSMEDRSYLPGLAMNRERDLLLEQKEDACYGRHLNMSVNVGYADGHVYREKAEDLFVEKTDEGYSGNLTPLWLPRKK